MRSRVRLLRLAPAGCLFPEPAIHVEIPYESILLKNPIDQLDETDQAILSGLKRLEMRPVPLRMRKPGATR